MIDAFAHSNALYAHAAATWWMAGVIWMVQLVHYPLMGLVGVERWREYEQAHCSRITFVVLPAMVLELASALLITWRSLASAGPAPVAECFGAALLALLWLSTFLVQTPLHMRLSERFEPAEHTRLVRTNWLRTLAWSARAVLALTMLP